jgi:hypothetical protein
MSKPKMEVMLTRIPRLRQPEEVTGPPGRRDAEQIPRTAERDVLDGGRC